MACFKSIFYCSFAFYHGLVCGDRTLYLRKGGHSLAKQLKARRLVKGESTPEEHAALKITEHLAQTFSLNVPTLYVLPDEVGVNALTAGFH